MKTSFPSICLSVTSHIHTFSLKTHVPGQELPSAVHRAHCTRVRSMCGGCSSGASCLIKTSCKPLRFHPQKVSLVSMCAQLVVFRFLPIRDCCDMGTGDETGLPQHTNTALHSRPCIQLVGMTQDAQGFIESCWGCCASQLSALAKLSLQGNRVGRWNAGHLANVKGPCRPVCHVWMLWDETYPPLSPSIIHLTPSFNPTGFCLGSYWATFCLGSHWISVFGVTITDLGSFKQSKEPKNPHSSQIWNYEPQITSPHLSWLELEHFNWFLVYWAAAESCLLE